VLGRRDRLDVFLSSRDRPRDVRRGVRALLGAALGGALLVGYLVTVGVEDVLSRAAAVTPRALALVVVLVVLEGLADAIGVWASLEPLGEGVTARRSVQFALAGDFFDVLSPAGPVSSEPIMARFVGVATGTGYADALGVRSVAKYVKSGTQLLVSAVLGLVVLLGTPETRALLSTLAIAVAGLVVLGGALLVAREHVSRGVVRVLAPVVTRVSKLYRSEPHDRSVVVGAVDRFWRRVLGFGGSPSLLGLIALGGVLEQVLTAAALSVALAGTGTPAPLLPLLVVVPLPQVASVVPIPGSLGAYDLLLGGALVLVTGASPAAAAAAVLVVRTVALPFGVTAGGICATFLPGWRLSAGRA
jgi:uncharacterized membrane protein YbhN (UPF0104 family)